MPGTLETGKQAPAAKSRSPDEAERNPGEKSLASRILDFAMLHPCYKKTKRKLSAV